MDPLIQLLIGIIAGFAAGAVGSAAVILINERKMKIVERVKRRILHGPEYTADGALHDLAALREKIYESIELETARDKTAAEIQANIAIGPPFKIRHLNDIERKTIEEMKKWLRENN